MISGKPRVKTLTGFGLWGNKTRKLGFLFGDPLARKTTMLLLGVHAG